MQPDFPSTSECFSKKFTLLLLIIDWPILPHFRSYTLHEEIY